MWVPQRQAWNARLPTVVSCDGEIYPQIDQTAGKETENVALFGTNRTSCERETEASRMLGNEQRCGSWRDALKYTLAIACELGRLMAVEAGRAAAQPG